jgi:hypothetical protein
MGFVELAIVAEQLGRVVAPGPFLATATQFAPAVRELGDDRFYKYIRAFGFGQQTGIELPGETRGMTKPVNRWSKRSH